MDFQKKFPLLGKTPNDYLLLQWERGYKNVEVIYRDQCIDTVANPSQIKKGYVNHIDNFGKLELLFSESPMTLNVIVDGFHSPINAEFPAKRLHRVSTVFWILFVFSIIGTFIESQQIGLSSPIGMIVLLINSIIVTIYLLAAIFTKKGAVWAYFLGSITFLVMTLLSVLVSLPSIGIVFFIQLAIRAGILYGLFNYFKTAMEIKRHAAKIKEVDNDLLDI